MTALRLDLVFPRFKLLSGAERAILGLAGAMVEVGHHVRLVCHQFDDSCRPRLAPGVDLVCTDLRLDWTRNRYLNAVFDYVCSFRLRGHLDTRADAQILFGPALPLAWSLRRVRRSHAAVLYYCWEPPRALYQDQELVIARLGSSRLLLAPLLRVYAASDRYLVRLVDTVCTSSPFAAGRIEECYGRPASVVTLGVDRQRFDGVREVAREWPPRVLTVNYLHPRKRVDLFVRAAAECGERWDGDRRPRWVIVGDGPERGNLEALARQLGVGERVQFAGFVSDEELPRYYAAATCYVHTGLEESFGLSVLEAAYCGCPVVAVDEGGVRETVEAGVTGHRVPPIPAAVAQAVEAVLSRDDHGRALGLAGHDRVAAKYSWEQGAADLIQLVERAKS